MPWPPWSGCRPKEVGEQARRLAGEMTEILQRESALDHVGRTASMKDLDGFGCFHGVANGSSERCVHVGEQGGTADAVVGTAKQRRLRLLTVGRRGEGIRIVETAIEGFTQRLKVVHGGTTYTVRLPLVGDFQVENALVAAGLAIATDSEPLPSSSG